MSCLLIYLVIYVFSVIRLDGCLFYFLHKMLMMVLNAVSVVVLVGLCLLFSQLGIDT